MWCLAHGVVQRRPPGDAEHEFMPRVKTWITSPAQVNPPQIKLREGEQGESENPILDVGSCPFTDPSISGPHQGNTDVFQSKYTLDTRNVMCVQLFYVS
jgi:hypothetical protein